MPEEDRRLVTGVLLDARHIDPTVEPVLQLVEYWCFYYFQLYYKRKTAGLWRRDHIVDDPGAIKSKYMMVNSGGNMGKTYLITLDMATFANQTNPISNLE